MRQLDVVAGTRAVAIHTRQQYLAATKLLSPHGPFNCILPNCAATAMRVNLPTTFLSPARINRHNHALTAKRFSARADQFRILDGGSVERDLVGAGTQDRANVFNETQTTANSERNKYFISYTTHQFRNDLSAV